MSARLLYTLTDEKRELERQMGCMNGILQLFERNHFLSGRRVNRHNHKSLPSGQNGNHATDPNSSTLHKSPAKNQKANTRDKQRISTESSRTSFSSSSTSCSSFSSVDNTKTSHLEPHLFSRTPYPATPTLQFPKNQPNASSKSLDLQDFVKGSMHRDVKGILVQPEAAERVTAHTMKYMDSPRLKPPSKFAEQSESFRTLSKLREAPVNVYNEKDGRQLSAPKFARRLSYDGWESNNTLKSTVKLKELPRLSLDSREDWVKCSSSGTRSTDLSSGSRPSTVVAKLMGLDAFPNSRSIDSGTSDPFSTSSRITYDNGLSRFGSPRVSYGDATSPSLKNNGSVLKHTVTSKFQMETARTRPVENNRQFQPPASICREVASSSCSVYGEIEKRLATLEFNKSGKDLRALKQILEAMQKTKVTLDNKRDQGSSIIVSRTSNFPNNNSDIASPRRIRSNNMPSIRARSPTSPKSSKSPIGDAAGLHNIRTDHPTDNRKGKANKQLTKDLTPRNTHLTHPSCQPILPTEKKTTTRGLKTTKSIVVQRHVSTEIPSRPGKIVGTLSPRLQLKFGLEKQSSPIIPSSDSSRPRRQTSRHNLDTTSSEIKPKSPSLGHTSKMQKNKTDFRDLIQYTSSLSVQSESISSLASDVDTEVTSKNKFNLINDSTQQDECKQKSSASGLSNRGSMAELAKISSEQPSPVSVLDSTFCQDDSPSPVKKISYAFDDDEIETPNPNEAEWNPVQATQSSNSRNSQSALICHKEVDKIQYLATSIQHANYNKKDLLIDVEPVNPHHSYISEILLASGILRDLDSGLSTAQLHSSGHAIDPSLFFKLEESKEATWSSNNKLSKNVNKSEPNDKNQRRLVFDVVNEIIVESLVAEGSSKQWFSPREMTGTKLRGQQLLKELCSKVDQLQFTNPDGSLDDNDYHSSALLWVDLMHQAKNWRGHQNEVAVIVLDVERLIFKDLITEVVTTDAGGLQRCSGGPYRQLFSQ